MNDMNKWNLIYDNFNPIAFNIFDFNVHWYGILYALALFSALFLAKYFVKKMPIFKDVSTKIVDNYFLWIEIGIILGARFGYLCIYTDDGLYYLLHPWQAFNPYIDGKFIGIAGMSYHGAVFGFLIASFAFGYFYKYNILVLLDLVAISLPLPYILGRIGNFLNKELYGREINIDSLKFIGIYIDNALRYPSQLIEAFLEGFVLFFVVFFVSLKVHKKGILIATYTLGYGISRFIAEYTREPDSQMGYYFLHLSMGQILSILMVIIGCALLYFVKKSDIKDKK